MNGILCINKPADMTSFDVVSKVRRKLNCKVGHSGTLDPMASGVLILAINQATKALPYLGLEDKIYHSKVKLGFKTVTGDIWGETLDTKEVPHFTEEDITRVFLELTGCQSQRVPKVSAKKINGKKSYDYVFENKEVMQLYTDITIYSIEFISIDFDEIEFRAKVSNGTYIRTLCEDIGEKLGTLGAMSYLNREQVGVYSLDQAINLEDLNEDTELISAKDTIPMERVVNEKLEDYVKNGKRLKLNVLSDRVLVDTGHYFAIYEREFEDQFKSIRGLW